MSAKRRREDAPSIAPVKRRKSTPEVELPKYVDAQKNGIQSSGAAGGHVRFGSEEPSQLSYESDKFVAEDLGTNEPEQDEFSDDEAPEAVKTHDAHASTLAAAVKARRAAESERVKARKKRREADERLKAQSRKPSKKNHVGEEGTGNTGDGDDPQEALKSSKFPDLLPEDLLTDDLFQRPPSPGAGPKSVVSKPKSTKKLIKFNSKPKDVRNGPVNVSVLEHANAHLPPKASKNSRDIREMWLAGSRGKQSRGQERSVFKRRFLSA